MNGNYSSNSSTTSSTHSNGKSNNSTKTTLTQLSRNDPLPSPESSDKKDISTDKMPLKKLANKSTQVDSPSPSLKTFSLSDSETCNTKLKNLPPNDYFRFPKSKAESSPVISTNSTKLPSGNNSPKRISHAFLSAINKDTLKKAGIMPEQRNLSYEKPENISYDQNSLAFSQMRSTLSMPSRYISTGSMLTEEMLLNGSLSRLRYMNPQNMHLLSEANVWTANQLASADCFVNSPSRKNFMPSVSQPKRR